MASKYIFSLPKDKAENAGDALLVGLKRLRWYRRHRALWSIIGSFLIATVCMLNYGLKFQPISASNRNRLHSVSATMILRGPRLDQGQRLLSYRMVSKDWPLSEHLSP